jgi:lysozyme
MTEDPALAIAAPLIERVEGFSSQPYRDSGRGVWTIGYGMTYLPDGTKVTALTPACTQVQAGAWLQIVASKTLSAVREMVYVPISNNAAAALTSFAYNEGTNALRTSTLMDRLNAKESMTEVAACFAAWVYAGGRVDTGLVNRRKVEAALFLKPDAVDTDEADILDDQYNPPGV